MKSYTHDVDVIIPVHERKELLISAIESVFAQSFVSFHITVIDDQSHTFKAYEVIASYIQLISDPIILDQFNNKVTVITLTENRGPAYCRNLGVARNKAPFIAFLDSDDLWHEEKLSIQIEYMKNNIEFGYSHTAEKWIRQNKEIKQKGRYKKQGGFFIERCFQRCLISTSAIVFRRTFWETLDEHFLPHFKIAEDYEFWLRLNFIYPAGYIDKPLTIKQAGDWSQLSSTSEIDRNRVLALHRFYRINKNHPRFMSIQIFWKEELLKKIAILIKGSTKYNHPNKLFQYQSWQKLMNYRFK